MVYQWESRQRTPSPVFWKRVEMLNTRLNVRRAQLASNVAAHHSNPLPAAEDEQPEADR